MGVNEVKEVEKILKDLEARGLVNPHHWFKYSKLKRYLEYLKGIKG